MGPARGVRAAKRGRERVELERGAEGAGTSGATAGVHPDVERVLLPEARIRERVRELGLEIARDFAGRRPLLVGILRGAVIFLADLARAIPMEVRLDFMAVSSYGRSSRSSGVVRILHDLGENIEGDDVVIVEDVIDSGLTLAYLRETLATRRPRTLKTCTLLQKDSPAARRVGADYVGFLTPNEFLVGYGLDYADRYRNLPYVGVLRREVYAGRG
ncbi:MAG: hypoxanthine phosphoribosyltransferase [Firmicutes bacterium]|nr:hypoxanthine phosphoribosyltransferase [Bacillota bacterium]